MGKKAGSRDVASDIRGGYVRAAKMLASEGKPISTFWYKLIQDDFPVAMKTLAQFIPKEQKIDMQGSNLTLVAVLSSITGDSRLIEGEHHTLENAPDIAIREAIDSVPLPDMSSAELSTEARIGPVPAKQPDDTEPD